jgi:hypothetical protein
MIASKAIDSVMTEAIKSQSPKAKAKAKERKVKTKYMTVMIKEHSSGAKRRAAKGWAKTIQDLEQSGYPAGNPIHDIVKNAMEAELSSF